VTKGSLLPPPVRTGRVTVVVVAAADSASTVAFLDRLDALEAPEGGLEAVVVVGVADLADDLVDGRPDRRLVTVPDPRQLATARNAGASAARGEYLAFLAVDAAPEPDALPRALDAIRANANVAAVASKVVGPDGQVQFAGAALTAAGTPVLLTAEPVDQPDETLFGTDTAFLVGAEAFRWVGGYDEGLASSVASADLGWRLWQRGFRVAYEPRSVVVAEAATPERTEDAEVERMLGSLSTLYKNYGDAGLTDAVATAVLAANGTPTGRAALARFNEALPQLIEVRRKVQADRVVGDAEILPLLRSALAARADGQPALTVARDALGRGAGSARVAVVTPDVLGTHMAGPAIRAWNIALALSREHDVQLVTTNQCDEALTHEDFSVRHVDDQELRTLAGWCDLMVFQGDVMLTHPWLPRTPTILVADMYDPVHLEVLEQSRDLNESARRHVVRITTEAVNKQLARADYFLCASDKQRDFWLGQLAGVGRLNPASYDGDESLNGLLTVVPFGVNDDSPEHTRSVMKGVVPGIAETDPVILWGGGVYNWFDPLTLIRAVDHLRSRIPNVRLYFMGMQHPNPGVPTMRVATQTRRLAEELGLVDEHVFFNEGWVAYEDRQNYLLEADVGVSTHFDHVETAFSFRTRILDYIWASLPIVATGGDSFGVLIEQRGLGITVPPRDEHALEDALFALLDDADRNAACRAAIAGCIDEFRWTRVLEPLREFCRAPRRAPDLVDPRQLRMIGDPMAQAGWGRRGWRYTAAQVLDHVRHREYDELIRKFQMRARLFLFPESAGPGPGG